jgi:hypothetical protein
MKMQQKVGEVNEHESDEKVRQNCFHDSTQRLPRTRKKNKAEQINFKIKLKMSWEHSLLLAKKFIKFQRSGLSNILVAFNAARLTEHHHILYSSLQSSSRATQYNHGWNTPRNSGDFSFGVCAFDLCRCVLWSLPFQQRRTLHSTVWAIWSITFSSST